MKLWRRRKPTQKQSVAKLMCNFFDTLERRNERNPHVLAWAYGDFLWDNMRSTAMSRSRYDVALSGDTDYSELTKRTCLVVDTLLLSHAWTGQIHNLSSVNRVETFETYGGEVPEKTSLAPSSRAYTLENERYTYGMQCPDLEELGRWIYGAEHLLRSGLAWYLPSYTRVLEVRENQNVPWRPTGAPERHGTVGYLKNGSIDYLIQGRKAIDVSGISPVMTKLIRPILQIELPFIEGVDLRTFSKITIEEFDSYTAFRDFLRERFESMDEAIDDVHRDHALARIGREIAEEVRAVQAEIVKVNRKRKLDAFGAGTGVVTAALVAVYGPALQEALTVLGLGAGLGGLWKLVQTISENSPRSTEGAAKWYYVWALQKEARRL